MKLTRKNFTVAFMVALAVLAFATLIGHPIVPMEALAGLGMLPLAMGDTDDVGIKEIKALIEAQGAAWAEHKRVNDELVKAKADGKAVSDIESKLAKLSDDLDKISEVKAQFDEFVLKSQRPGAGGSDADRAKLEVETKAWNEMLRADYQSKGRQAPNALATDAYAQYKSAFFAMVRHGNMDKLSDDERKAMSAGSDPDGGYLLPEATVGRMVARVYERSAMRRLANVQTLSTNDLEGIVDNDEASAGWVAEMDDRTDTNTPQVGKYRIEAHEMYAQPKATQKLIDDSSVDIEAWLAMKVGDKFARVESTAFMTGNGVSKPFGLFAYPTAATGDATRAWGTFEHVATGASATFASTKGDVLQDLLGTFKDHYLANASFVMPRSVRTLIRKFKSASTDLYLWEPSLQVGQPDRLLGYPVVIDQYVPTLAASSLSLGFGDVREAYTIVDRIGIRTLRDPFTAKPYVRFYSTKRTGGGAVNFEAFKFLKFV